MSSGYVATRRKDARALGSLLTGEVAARFVGQLAVLVSARLLGPNDFGILAVALTVLGFGTVLADLGLGETAVSRLTHRPTGVSVYSRVVAPTRLRAAAVVAVVMTLVALVGHANQTLASSMIVGLAIPGSIVITNRYLRARLVGDFPLAAKWSATNGLSLWLGAVAGAVVTRTALGAVIGVVSATSAVALVTRTSGEMHGLRRLGMSAWLKASLPLLTAGLAIAVYSRVDRLFVASLQGPAAAGIYSAAYNVVMLAAVVGAAVQAGLLPRLVHEHNADLMSVWRKRLTVLAAGATLIAILVWVLAPIIIRVLYGPAYAESAGVLRWLSPLVALYIATPFVSAVLLARRQTRAIAATSLTNLVISLGLYPVAIAAMGIVGAAAASVVIECAGLGQQVIWLLVSDRRKHGS